MGTDVEYTVIVMPKRISKKLYAGLLGCALLLSAASTSYAAPITFDLTTGSSTTTATQSGSGLGNSWVFTDPVTSTQLTAYAWSDEGGSTLTAAQSVRDGLGTGTCNSTEDTTFSVFGFPITIPCTLFGARRPADNAGGQDWVLLVLPDGGLWGDVNINVQGGAGGDGSYWIGDIASPDLSGATYADLESTFGFYTRIDFSGSGNYTINLGDIGG